MTINGEYQTNLQVGPRPDYTIYLLVSATTNLKEGETVVFTANQTSCNSLAVTFDLLIESSK